MSFNEFLLEDLPINELDETLAGKRDNKAIEDKDNDGFACLSNLAKQELIGWILCRVEASSKINKNSSYKLKHFFEKETGVYVTNLQFKVAMVLAEHEPVNRDELNHKYCIKLVNLGVVD